jgi:hypothetical protein
LQLFNVSRLLTSNSIAVVLFMKFETLTRATTKNTVCWDVRAMQSSRITDVSIRQHDVTSYTILQPVFLLSTTYKTLQLTKFIA